VPPFCLIKRKSHGSREISPSSAILKSALPLCGLLGFFNDKILLPFLPTFLPLSMACKFYWASAAIPPQCLLSLRISHHHPLILPSALSYCVTSRPVVLVNPRLLQIVPPFSAIKKVAFFFLLRSAHFGSVPKNNPPKKKPPQPPPKP